MERAPLTCEFVGFVLQPTLEGQEVPLALVLLLSDVALHTLNQVVYRVYIYVCEGRGAERDRIKGKDSLSLCHCAFCCPTSLIPSIRSFVVAIGRHGVCSCRVESSSATQTASLSTPPPVTRLC